MQDRRAAPLTLIYRTRGVRAPDHRHRDVVLFDSIGEVLDRAPVSYDAIRKVRFNFDKRELSS